MCNFKCCITYKPDSFCGTMQIAVARGHPRIATENYKKTLEQSHLDSDLYKLGFHLPNPVFVMRTVEEIFSLFPHMELSA